MPPAPRGRGGRRRMTSVRAPSRSPSVASSPAPSLPPQAAVQAALQSQKQKPSLDERYQCPSCEPHEANVVHDPDQRAIVCYNCGTVISEFDQLENEVTFGETSTGAAVVQGTTFHEGQRHTHIPGLGYAFAQQPDQQDRFMNAMRVGNEEMRRIGNRLNLPEYLMTRANGIYELIRIHAFQRPLSENCAIAIYTACREYTGCQILLIDLAEIIHVNVYELGAAYKKFIDHIGLRAEYRREQQKLVEPEPLIKRFASRLEFGNDTTRVATDAAIILSRMRRDWMVTGRQPMGLIGACLIIAARMNNYRRTLREVVFVVRAGEMTILKRLNEFSTTAAARLTVDQFRKLREDEAFSASIHVGLPPSLTNPPKKKQKTVHFVDDASTIASSSRQSSVAPSEAQPRRDKDGFVIPKLPASAASGVGGVDGANDKGEPDGVEEEEEAPRKRGRPKKLPLPEVHVTDDDLRIEEAMEKEIAENVQVIETDKGILEERGQAWFKAKERAAEDEAAASKASKWKLSDVDLLSETIGEDEFEDDPEVKYCKLSEREVEVKEKIWVTHNHDWLRAQQERTLQEQLAAARGKKKRTGPRKKMPRRGDGSVLGGSAVESAAEASSRMLMSRAKRVKYSKNVDYARLREIYGDDMDDSSQAGSPSRSASRAISRAVSESPTPSVAASVTAGAPRTPSVASEGPKDAREDSATPAPQDEEGAGPQEEVEIPDDDPTDDEEEEDDIDDTAGFLDDDDYGQGYGDDGDDDEEDPLQMAAEYGLDMGDGPT